MSEQQKEYPQGWQITGYRPGDNLTDLKGREYLNVQNRLLWFVSEQRMMIVSGLAKVPYVVQTELVELDREKGFAHFKTTVRDVLGNEAVAYGSETSKDFGDYIEKGGTKSLGRALLGLGYGTANAQELNEGERVVDSPQEPRRRQPTPSQRPANGVRPQRPVQSAPQQPAPQPAPATDETLDDFDLMDNTDLAAYAGILGTDYRNEFVRLCGIKPKGGYTDEDGATWRAHLLAKARAKAAIERKHGSLRELPGAEGNVRP